MIFYSFWWLYGLSKTARIKKCLHTLSVIVGFITKTENKLKEEEIFKNMPRCFFRISWERRHNDNYDFYIDLIEYFKTFFI